MRASSFDLPGAGALEQWPVTLRVAVGLMNDSLLPMSVVWGPERRLLYNDAYIPFLGDKHPGALGQRLEDVWSDIWPEIGPLVDRSRGGEAFHVEDLCLYLRRNGHEERTWFSFYYSPLRDENWQIRGMCSSAVETTSRVLAERRQTALLMLNDELARASGLGDIVAAATWTLQDYLDRCTVSFTQAAKAGHIHVPLQAQDDAGFFAISLQRSAAWTPLDQLFAEEVARRAAAALERSMAAHALLAASEGERRFRLMADATPQIVWTTDDNGRIEFFNNQWRSYTGQPLTPKTSDDLVADFVHPDDRLSTKEAIAHARRHQTSCQVEHRLRGAAGGYRWFLVRCVPLRDPQGQGVRWFSVCTDIHERVVAEETLREEDRRKDEFLATLAHELRNPLAPVRTSLQILRLLAPVGSDPATTAIATMDRQIGHMVHLIDDLLDLSRIRRGNVTLKRERLTMSAVLDTALEASRPLIDAGRHSLTLHLQHEPMYVDADLTRMAQVVSNLLNNAAKYTPEGGRIDLTVLREGASVVIRVTDSGVGIALALQDRVFDMFAQLETAVDRAKGGLGIGLWITQRLVQMHGGTITVHSPGAGQGTSFEVRVPAADELATQPDSARQGDNVAAEVGKVLVVDDNVDAAETLALMLEMLGHQTRTAHSGAEALAVAASFGPSVVVCDIGMPGMNGWEVARRMRDEPELSRATLIALTGWGSEEARQRSRDAGFDLHLTKPVDLARLNDALARRAHSPARQG